MCSIMDIICILDNLLTIGEKFFWKLIHENILLFFLSKKKIMFIHNMRWSRVLVQTSHLLLNFPTYKVITLIVVPICDTLTCERVRSDNNNVILYS